MPTRVRSVLVAAALAFTLVAGSAPRIVGDGGEYLAQALNFSMINGPALARRTLATIEPRIHALSPELAAWQIQAATVQGPDLRRDFQHFWFYALLVTPAVWLTAALGASPLHAFTVTNVALLATAIWVLIPRVGPWVVALVCGSPLIWWLDKPHTEVFTVSLVAIALGLMRDRPGVSLVAAGMAATQNVPVVTVYGAIGLAHLAIFGRQLLHNRGWLTGAALGGALALLHPTYTYLRHGTPSLLLSATRDGVPTIAELLAIVFDPTLGLAGNAPFFLIASAGAALVVARHWRKTAHPDLLVAAVSAAAFLYSCAQTSNTHHGATPSLSRYALWLLPLSVPLLSLAVRVGGAAWRAAFRSLTAASVVTSVVAFHPNVPQNGREPTSLAVWLWTNWPAVFNPLPEVFSETILGVEGTTVPATTERCEKVLLAPGDAPAGTWPVPCYPAELPAHCSGREVLCFANRADGRYAFARPPGRERAPRHESSLAWPLAAEPHVRTFYRRWGWWELSAAPPSVRAIRGSDGVRATTFGHDNRFVMTIRILGGSPIIYFRLPGPRLTGEMVDAGSGERLQDLEFVGSPGDLSSLPLPADKELLLLALTAGEIPR